MADSEKRCSQGTFLVLEECPRQGSACPSPAASLATSAAHGCANVAGAWTRESDARKGRGEDRARTARRTIRYPRSAIRFVLTLPFASARQAGAAAAPARAPVRQVVPE